MSEKIAQEIQNKLFSEVYVPALVTEYNEKAASAGLDPIKTEEDLQQALGIVEFIHQKGASRSQTKQASAFSKAASVINGQPQQQKDVRQERASYIAKAAASDPELIASLKKLVEENKED